MILFYAFIKICAVTSDTKTFERVRRRKIFLFSDNITDLASLVFDALYLSCPLVNIYYALSHTHMFHYRTVLIIFLICVSIEIIYILKLIWHFIFDLFMKITFLFLL